MSSLAPGQKEQHGLLQPLRLILLWPRTVALVEVLVAVAGDKAVAAEAVVETTKIATMVEVVEVDEIATRAEIITTPEIITIIMVVVVEEEEDEAVEAAGVSDIKTTAMEATTIATKMVVVVRLKGLSSKMLVCWKKLVWVIHPLVRLSFGYQLVIS